MADLLLVLGGVRSGKSTYAEQRARALAGPVAYLATADPADFDQEMRQRVAVHRADRPADWLTLEAPEDLAAALRQLPASVPTVLLDCLTVWLGNVLVRGTASLDDAALDAARADLEARTLAQLDALLAAVRDRPGLVVAVSNEVGLGVVPPYKLGRLYRDLLGRVNQRVAAAAIEVVLLVAGIPLTIKAPTNA